eukprot:522579-Rhodomonas_salina.2
MRELWKWGPLPNPQTSRPEATRTRGQTNENTDHELVICGRVWLESIPRDSEQRQPDRSVPKSCERNTCQSHCAVDL